MAVARTPRPTPSPPTPAGLRSVTAFSSSADVDEVFFTAARDFGHAVATRGWTLVYGGNRIGPMGAMADAARAAGGHIVGVTPKFFGNCIDNECHELILVDDMRQRKAVLETRADAFVTLPGGLGTMEEFFEIVVGRYLKQHNKPLVLLNIDKFYDPLVAMMQRGIETGFVRPSAWHSVHVSTSVDDAVAYLERFSITDDPA